MDLNKQPSGFMIYNESMSLLSALSDDAAGRLFKAGVKYFRTGLKSDFSDVEEQICFQRLCFEIDNSVDKYRTKQLTGYKNRKKSIT